MADTEGTLHGVVNSGFPMSNVAIERGDVVELDASGNLIVAQTGSVIPLGVAAEGKDNSTGTAGGVSMTVTLIGVVEVTADGVIPRGSGVKVSGATAGEVIVSVIGDDPNAVLGKALALGADGVPLLILVG